MSGYRGTPGVIGATAKAAFSCMVRRGGARGFGRRWLMRSCVNVFGLRLEHVLRAIMDISAHAILLADKPRRAVSKNFGDVLGRKRKQISNVCAITHQATPSMASPK